MKALPFDLPQTDPTPIYRYRDGLYAVDLLITAVCWLDLFTLLARKPSDKPTLCQNLSLHPRPVDVMITLFVAMEFLQENEGKFELTPLAREHLVKGSPWYLGPYYDSLKERPVCKDLLNVLRTGKPAHWGSLQDEKAWANAMEEETFARNFTAAMDCRGYYLATSLAKRFDPGERRQLLDIAGGSGIYACAIAAEHKSLSATVFEKPPVDGVAKTIIAERGFSSRVSIASGDMFKDPFPSGFDLHLFSNVLHDWDEEQVAALVKKSFESLAPGGMLIVHDAHINATKTGPLHVAEYSVLLMHSTEGNCYSVTEMELFLTEAGFGEVKFLATAASRSIMTAVKQGVNR